MGHFSTIGDLEVLATVSEWLEKSQLAYDIAPFEGAYRQILPRSVDWRKAHPENYGAVVFVCGPMVDSTYLPGFFERFINCPIFGVNLSVGSWLNGFSPFTKLWARDDGDLILPDLSLLYRETKVPVVGVCLIHAQEEYKGRQRNDLVEAMVNEFLRRRDLAVIRWDTEALPSRNICRLGSVNAITSLVRCCDVVITSRLHGTVLSLKQGIPVLAIDSVMGGAKVLAQASVLGWPHAVPADELSLDWLDSRFEQCLSSESRDLARSCALASERQLSTLEGEFRHFLETSLRR